ncbi:alpha/beta hydrolase-fold protein [Sphingobium sp. CFD-1]|uniref:alpha/beta hydrolase-fold protein n=1 Tax=Sphingobium sp. CFD-1 TaxID=2878545 RepID=UPI0027D46494|nr:alpha/beta hydrolase-fold protein [Sphingobium sp. CFD-1]
MIEFHNVHKEYHTRRGINHVLRGADISILAGEKVGILGRNGAGKSTTIRLLSGSELPTSGIIKRSMSVSWPLAFGGAFQGALTGRDNAKCISRIYGRKIEDTIGFVQDFAELGVYFDEPVRNYSSGMAARLAFAISMSIEFDCFLIDEIVHVGDHRFHEKCQIELFEKRADRSLVIVSHSEDFVRQHCDRAYVLKDGKLLSFKHIDDAIDFHIESLHKPRDTMSQDATHAMIHDANDQYCLGPDSLAREGIPKGRIEPLVIPPSSLFPDCQHDAWLYLPANYDGLSALPLMIFEDGWLFLAEDGGWQVPTVLDNLIADGGVPKMAALFIESGKPRRPGGLAEEQRSLEYDSVGGDYAEFLLAEVLPIVRQLAVLSDDPSDRGIAGYSSGGICAFNAAWHRPDAFGKVFSACGSFVDIRGGGCYPERIRNTPAKPLRVFLQEGARAKLGGKFSGLDWPAGNRAMARALAMQNYAYQFVMGEGDHSHHHGAAILPDALRWLWREHGDISG